MDISTYIDSIDSIFDKNDYGVFVYRVEDNFVFRLIYSNKLNAELAGIKYPDCINLTLDELNSTYIRTDHFKQQMLKCSQTQIPINYVRSGTVNGVLSYINVTIIPFIVKDVPYIIGYNRTLKSVEEVQHYIHLKTSTYFSGEASNGYVLLNRTNDGTWICETCNDIFPKIIRKTKNDILKKPITEILSPTQGLLIPKKADECLAKLQVIEYHNDYNIDNTYKHWHVSMLPVFLGDKIMVYCCTNDVTDEYIYHHQANDMLSKYTHLCNLSLSGIASCSLSDDELKINTKNDVFEKLYHLYLKTYNLDTSTQMIKETLAKDSENKYSIKLPSEDNSDKLTTYTVRIIPISEFLGEHKFLIITSKLLKKHLSDITDLTSREKQLLELVIDGCTNKYIAHKLGLSEGTVKKHLYNAYQKLNVGSRIELISEYTK